ncbi:bacteriocin-like protein [Chryseobacterium schmidteae]|uniref:bacteriocin-like protein n=1 Tax=Chryseobacterium schmidteae TaxID=2730404 RepID=UPI00158C5694|nr:hypothetical protein [Chryseobacterium schmidteae]
MKNLKKISRNQMKNITGSDGIIVKQCVNICCPPPGQIKCPKLICPAVVCPQYV